MTNWCSYAEFARIVRRPFRHGLRVRTLILRDAVHGLVSFETEEEQIVPHLLEAAEVQRLRRIKQLGVASYAFPGAEHSRFAHAIGAAHVMKMLLTRLRHLGAAGGGGSALPEEHRITPAAARDALAAALLHDVGHGPLSHLFEGAIGETGKHEEWTVRVIVDPSTDVNRILRDVDPHMPSRVAKLVRGEHPLPYLAGAVSGTFDVDRCDYLLRDAYATGVRYGIFDMDWLLRSLRFGKSHDGAAPGLAIDGAKGLPAIEAFVLARLFMFQQVYLHKATRAAEWMIRTVLERARKLLAAGTDLAGTPRALVSAARGELPTLADYITLDDHVLSVTFSAWESAKDAALSDVARRVRERKLFKTLELFGEQASPRGRENVLADVRALAAKRGLDPEVYVGLDVSTCTAFADDDDLAVVFEKGPERPLREVSFIVGRLAGEEVTRTRLVFASELREEVLAGVGLA